MKKVYQIALREIVVTVSNRAFLIGLLVMPAMLSLFALFGPRLFNFQNFKVEGQLRVIDLSGSSIDDLRVALDARKIAARRAAQAQAALDAAPAAVRSVAQNAPAQAVQNALGP